jgi:hypothetical protein
MALVRKPLENISTHPTLNKEFQWGDTTVDDLFERFINPDSFNLTSSESGRNSSDDFISFFDTHASSSGNDTIDISPIPVGDATHILFDAEKSWHRAALSFVEEHTASHISSIEQSRSSINSQTYRRSASSDSDLLRHQRVGTPVPLETSNSSTRTSPTSSNINTTKNLFDTPLVVRKKHRGPSSCVGKPTRRGSASPKMMSPSHYKMSSRQSSVWARQMQAAAADGQLNFKMPSYGRTASASASAQMKSETFGYKFSEHEPLRSLNDYQEDTDPLSPLSNGNGFGFFQPPNTPVASPPFEDSRTSSYPEPQPSPQLSAYPSTPYTVHTEHTNLLMTPPQTQPMINGRWTHDVALAVSSPDFAHMDKAEAWWEPSSQQADPSEVSCGAPAANNMLGLGISGIHDAKLALVTSNAGGIIQPSAVSLGAASTPATSPTPRSLTNHHQGTASFSASASSKTASMYPMSPLQNHARQAHHMQQQQQPSPYRRHQRHHTVSTPLSISPAEISRSIHYRRTPSASPPPPVRSHRRTKSSTTAHRKSSTISPRQTSVGFVNFTPDDSRKILTGVAPSGSSKTKARREKEAADKRRKLSEAAKKAVLEAGGDLGTLEREGLLVLGSDL